MAIVQFEKFNFNQFYEKTPTVLKYILVMSLIILGSYFLFSKKVSKGQETELDKIEQTIETTYTLIDRFDDFRKAQYVYNSEILDYLENIYTLVKELNENTNKKLDLIISQGGENTSEILERLTLLNESYEKLQKAYTPKEFEDSRVYKGEVEFIPIDEFGNPESTDSAKYSIKANPIKK